MADTILYLSGSLVRTSRLLLEGLSAFAAEHGWKVLRVSPPQGAGAEYLRHMVAFWQAAGVVEDCGPEAVPLPGGAPPVPFVCIDLDPRRKNDLARAGRGAALRRVGFVHADSDAFVRLAARELLQRDFASYAYVSAYRRRHWSERRREVFRTAVEDAGGRVRTFNGLDIEAGDAAAMRRLGAWLKALPKPCGILAANDRTATFVLTAAARNGIDVPGMANVIGIDDDEMLCETISPSLTSVQADFFGGGHLAGQLLADLRAGTAADGTTLLYGARRIVHRLSTRRLGRQQMPSVKNALEAIRRRAAEGISAADILPMLGGSRRSAEKRFKAATGKSILEEIIDVRFERLVPLLEQGGLSLGSLAGHAGFTSEKQLQRQFKARFGMTMGDYRRRHRQPRPADAPRPGPPRAK